MITLVLLILALVCFILDALAVPVKRIRLTPLGLALWVLSLLITSGAGVWRVDVD